MEKEITVFICEDEATRKEIVERFMFKGKITYAALFKESVRTEITEALDKIQ